MDSAFFTEAAARKVEGGYAVYPNTLLFRAGDYPDKQFSMSADELKARATNWSPVKGNVQHTDFLKGRAGTIERAWTPDEGKTLFGEVKIPLGLDALLTENERKLSMEWNRLGKFEEGFALVTNPYISDAVLMSLDSHPGSEFANGPDFLEAVKIAQIAAFAGRKPLQSLHDSAADMGAECGGKALFDAAQFMTPDELKALQHIHDHCAKNGADCNAYQTRKSMYFSTDKTDKTVTTSTITHTVARPDRAGKGANTMSWLKGLFSRLQEKGVVSEEEAAQFAKAAEEEQKAQQSQAGSGTADFSQSDAYKNMAKEIDDLRNQTIAKDAEAFYQAAFSAGKVYPSEKAALIASYCQAAKDDRANPAVVTFAVGDEQKQGSRLDALTAQVAARPGHGMFGEALPGIDPDKHAALFGAAKTSDPAKEGYEEGKAAAAAFNGKSNGKGN